MIHSNQMYFGLYSVHSIFDNVINEFTVKSMHNKQALTLPETKE